MKVLNKVLIGVASVAMLTACASKTDYASFHSKAVEAGEKAKEVSFSKVVLSGSYVDEDGKKQSYDNVTIKFEKGSYAAGGLTDTTLAQAGAVVYLTAMQVATLYVATFNKECKIWVLKYSCSSVNGFNKRYASSSLRRLNDLISFSLNKEYVRHSSKPLSKR